MKISILKYFLKEEKEEKNRTYSVYFRRSKNLIFLHFFESMMSEEHVFQILSKNSQN